MTLTNGTVGRNLKEDFAGDLTEDFTGDRALQSGEVQTLIGSADPLTPVLSEVVRQLPEADRVVVDLHFGLGGHEPLSIDEIAVELQLTAQDVRGVLDTALRKLRSGRAAGFAHMSHWLQ